MSTTYPENPSQSYDEWRKYISQQVKESRQRSEKKNPLEIDSSPEEIFEAKFMRIWSDFKSSIERARTRRVKE